MNEQEIKALLDKVKNQTEEVMTAKGVKKEDITKAIDEKMKAYEGLNVDALKNIVEDFETMKQEHLKLKNDLSKRNTRTKKTLKGEIQKSFRKEETIKELERVARQKSGMVELFSTKEVGPVLTTGVTTDTGGNALLDLINADDLKGLNLRDPFVEQFATVTRSSKPVYTYADYIPKEGSVTFKGEGGTKTQLDLKVEVKTVTPKKAAGYMIHSTEVIQDVPRMESESRTLLLKKYLLKRQNGILFGDGNNDTPVGVTGVAKAFNPTSWTGDATLDNLHDKIIAAANQIYMADNYDDEVQNFPNVAFVNPADFADLRVTKAQDSGIYLFPAFTLFNERAIDGIAVVPKKEIPSGKLLIGDFTKLNIVNYIDYTVSMGWINDQFIKNLFTMVGEGRFYTIVRELDEIAFIYDDLSNIVKSS
jgi:HK97 family phage major capsid protein